MCSRVYVLSRAVYAACENCEGYADTRNKDHKGRHRRRCRSSESRCRLRKSRKEFDVLVDGGSSITVNGSVYRTHTSTMYFPCSSLPLLFHFFIVVFATLCIAWSRAKRSREKKTRGLKNKKQRKLVNYGCVSLFIASTENL